MSCTCGGDNVTRHNKVRDKIFGYSARAMLHPELERAGLLAEPGVMINMRRPADVLIQDGTRELTQTALDVKIINALGPDHYNATLGGPLKAAEACRDQALLHQNTAALCEAQGIAYEALVFTCQGGCESHAEAILSRIAAAIAKCEGVDATSVKAGMMEDISLCIGRSVVHAIQKRAQPVRTSEWPVLRSLEEAAESDAEDDE